MNKIVIIGANESVNLLILKAKALGYETHVFAWKVGDIGERSADFFYPISIEKKENILDICKTISPIGIASITSDFAVKTVNYVARELGLICNSEKTDRVSRNKYHMRLAFKEEKLFTPWFEIVDKSFSLDKVNEFKYPLIVKPTDRWSSKGVCRVNSSDELSEAIRSALAESYEKKAIIEGFMEGPEYSCECISYAGKHTVLSFTKKYTTGDPHYIETGHLQPSDLSANLQNKITPIIFQALDALNIEYGASHTEFRLLDNGEVGIIEVGARMGGDCIGTDLVQISTGYDYIRMVIDVATGKEPSFQQISNPKTAIVKFILNDIDMEKLRLIKEKYPQYIWRISEISDIGKRDVVDSSTRFGYFILAIENADVDMNKNLVNLLFG
ncbi:MAG TPA: ATP-grasp domain-containing protein [Patescibacteria group bacterium]|nr:ATP-grasp domain-containing protein [Patescibacteria group bacterium]